MMHTEFTKYEVARILGARALQIAMDAPLLLKISEQQLKDMRYDSLKIARAEFESDVLPISINRPLPRRHKDKLTAIKEERVSDEDLVAKEREVEKEIVEDAETLGLVENEEEIEPEAPASDEQ